MQVDGKKSPDIFTSEGDLDISKLAGKTKDLLGVGNNSDGVKIRTTESESKHKNRDGTGYDDVLTRNVEVFGTYGEDVIDMRFINYSGDEPEVKDSRHVPETIEEIIDYTKVRGLAGDDRIILHAPQSSSAPTPRHGVSTRVEGGAGDDVIVQSAPYLFDEILAAANIRVSGGKGTDTLVIKLPLEDAELDSTLGILFVQRVAVEPDVEKIKFTDQALTYDELKTITHGG